MNRSLTGPDTDWLRTFCHRWGVRELSVFGSALRTDFGPASDVDVLVVFDAAATPSLFDLVDMRDELAQRFGREVDLVEAAALSNPFRRRTILADREVLYAA
jgi:predicted nucleotidyltransferase